MAYLALGQKSLESSDPCYIIGTDQLITMKYIQQLQLATLSQKLCDSTAAFLQHLHLMMVETDWRGTF